MPQVPGWVWKLLRGGTRILVRQAAKRAVKKYCESCREQKTHDEHEDESGNSHTFCRSCDQQN